MKKLFFVLLSFLSFLVLVGCGSTAVSETPMSNETSVASLSYISAGLMEAEIALYEEDSESSNGPIFLSYTYLVQPETTTSFEGELDFINIYMDRLKVFMDDGMDQMNVSEETSDNEEYSFMFTFQVEEESYTVYYNNSEDSDEMTGIMVADDTTYDLVITDTTKEEDGETKRDIVMTATKDEDYIETHLQTKTEDGETKQYIYISKDISGNTSDLEIIIKDETDGTFSVEINEEINSYKFKVETTDEGTHYKLDYDIDGVKGFVLINQTTNEDGVILYTYQIHENGNTVTVDKEKPEKKDKDK